MQEVILVREDNHGLIAVTLDYFSAVKYLVENNWLTDTIEVGVDEDLEEVIVAFGADWVDEILKSLKESFIYPLKKSMMVQQNKQILLNFFIHFTY